MRLTGHAIMTAALLLFSAAAQAKEPKWVKKAVNSVFEIVAYDQDGQETGRSRGFFIDTNGTGITDRSILAGAASAVTIDAAGTSRPVNIVLGADDMYDVVRFSVTPDKKLCAVPLSNAQATEKSDVRLLPYTRDRKPQTVGMEVRTCQEIAGKRFYYTLDAPWQEQYTGCPVFDEDGDVVGIVQKGQDGDACTYLLDANFVSNIQIAAMSLDTRAYQDISIRKSLPQDPDQALAYVIMKQSTLLSADYCRLLEDFLYQFPDNPDGLFNMGSYLILETDSTSFERGIQYIEQSIEKAGADDRDRFHCDYASLIYNCIVEGQAHPSDWTLDKALDETVKALEINDQPQYYQLKGNILYAMKRYQDSYDSFVRLNSTSLASPDTYMFCYSINRQMGGSAELGLALLDSALMKYPTPMPRQAASVLLERALHKEEMGLNREAVGDYNKYEELLGSYNMSARFYLLREQVEIKAKLYEPALADIDRAIEIEPADSSLILEKGSLLLRVGEYEKALPILLELVSTYPDSGEIHRLTGVCYMRRGDDDKACYHLTTASSLGDTVADPLIPQVCK